MDHGRWWLAGVVSLAGMVGVVVYATDEEPRTPSVEIRREPGTLPRQRDREVRSQRPRGRIGEAPKPAAAPAAVPKSDAGTQAKASAPTEKWLPAGFELTPWWTDQLRGVAGLERWHDIQPWYGYEQEMRAVSTPELRALRAHYGSYQRAFFVLCGIKLRH